MSTGQTQFDRLLSAHLDKNQPGSGIDGRYAQYRAAEADAWKNAERDSAWGTVAVAIADAFHSQTSKGDTQ